jgi:ParB family chromosome partitioning protein
MRIPINKIKVAARIRKDIGKIDELAANIREHGLIAPIAVMPSGEGYRLLAGLRRLRAVELNGGTEIDAKVFAPSDAETALGIEVSENEQREPFTFTEKMEFAALLKEIEQAKALERKRAGTKSCENDLPPLGAGGSKGETRQVIASKIGMG